jgi:hypothetical protein
MSAFEEIDERAIAFGDLSNLASLISAVCASLRRGRQPNSSA